MAKSHKSATLPTSLRLNPPPAEENENFFSKLKKKLKFKKVARFNTDVSTGDCENVSVVSFRKTETEDFVTENDSPFTYQVGRASTRETRSESPKLAKPAARSHSDRYLQTQLVKASSPRRFRNGDPLMKNSKTDHLGFQNDSKVNKNNCDGRSVYEATTKSGNEYSSLTFSSKDSSSVLTPQRSQFENALTSNNDYLGQDDSAIDLETYHVDGGVDTGDDQFSENPVIQKSGQILTAVDTLGQCVLPCLLKEDVDESEVPSSSVPFIIPCDVMSCDSQEFDPNYESVQEVREKLKQQTASVTLVSEKSQSVDSLIEPGYQSIDEVKKKALAEPLNLRECKQISKSEDSLNEPGYESLNDVKNRISCGQFEKVGSQTESEKGDVQGDIGGYNLQDSALGISTYADAQETEIVDTASSEKPDESKDNDLYSVVNKGGKNEAVEDTQSKDETDCPSNTTQVVTVSEPKYKHDIDAYDSDVELSLDPGYAECADAIKGSIVPYSVYSDGSSKISSCTSLDYSVEDFPPEPGYAECADAIKTGAVKKISISHERLVEMVNDAKHRSHEDNCMHEAPSEIYANPQILLRKKSRLLEDRNSGDFSMRCLGVKDTEIGGSIESINSNNSASNKVCKPLTAEEEAVDALPVTPEAPPLPARNYSIYLDSEEGETIVADELIDSQIEMDDDAFDEAEEDRQNELEDVTCNEEQKCETRQNEVEEGKCDKEQKCETRQNEVEEVKCDKEQKCETRQNEVEEVKCFEERMCENFKAECDGVGIVSGNVGEHVESERERVTEIAMSETKDVFFTIGQVNEIVDKTERESLCHGEDVDHLHVVVKDNEGKKSVLTIIEKENNTEQQKRLKSVSKKSTEEQLLPNVSLSLETSEKCAVSEDSGNMKDCQVIVQNDNKTEDCHVNAKSDDDVSNSVDKVEENTGKFSEQAYQEECEIASCDGQHIDAHAAANCDTLHSTLKCTTDVPTARPLPGVTPVLKVSPTVTIDMCTNSDVSIGQRIDVNSDKPENICNENVVQDGDSNSCCGSIEDIKPLPIVANSFLESVGMLSVSAETSKVRMQSISADSDSDECFHHDLPKLEINESDLDDTFHISGEKEAQLFKDISKLSQEDNQDDGTGKQKNDVNKSVRSQSETLVEQTKTGRFDNAICHSKLDSSSSDSQSNDTTIDSPLCVIDNVAQSKQVEMLESADGRPSELLSEDTFDDATPRYDAINQTSSGSVDTSPCKTGFPGVPESHQFPESAMFQMSDSWPIEEEVRYDEACFHDDKPPSSSQNNIPDTDVSDDCHDYKPPPRPPALYSAATKTCNVKTAPGSPPLGEANYVESTDSPPAIPPRVRVRRPPPPVHGDSRDPSQDFMESMRQLKDCGWYWGPLSWSEAEQKLANKPEGTFLVRDSSDERYILSLSFKSQGHVHHTRIEHHKGNFSFWSQPDSHGKTTIKEFIEQCVTNSRNGRFLYFIRPSGPGSPPMPIHLLNPVSRFTQMRSLQHMCRFRILQMVRRDHIDSLPMPKRMKEYLKEAQYYVEYLDD